MYVFVCVYIYRLVSIYIITSVQNKAFFPKHFRNWEIPLELISFKLINSQVVVESN